MIKKIISWQVQKPVLVIFLAVGAVTVLGISLNRPQGSLSHIFLYLLVVTVAAFWWGLWQAAYAFMLSLMAVLYFFVPPRGSLSLDFDANNYTAELLGLAVFLVLSIFIAYLIGALRKERDRATALAKAERMAHQEVLRTSATLERERKRQEFLKQARQALGDTIEPEQLLQKILDGLIEIQSGSIILSLNSKNSPAGRKFWAAGNLSSFEEDLFAGCYLVMPLKSSGQLLGTLGYRPADTGAEDDELKEADLSTVRVLGQYIAIALENSALYHQLEFQGFEIARLLKGNLGADLVLNKRADQLSIFYRLSAAVLSGVNQEDLMILALNEVARMLESPEGLAILSREEPAVVAVRGTYFVAAKNPTRDELENTKGCQLLDGPQLARLLPSLAPGDHKLRVALVVPVESEGERLGLMVLGNNPNQNYYKDDLAFASGIADFLALALVSKRYYQEREKAASIDERSRIARELHDGLAQTINYLGLKIQLLHELVIAGEEKTLVEELDKLEKATDTARKDIREALYGLRHTNQDRSLIESLADLVHSTAENSGIKIRFNPLPVTGWPVLSISAQIQLLRVIQEALANVQKHSRASEAELTAIYLEDNGLLRFTIRDNGIGFKPEANGDGSTGHFGLGIMRERALKVDASLTIDSRPGAGTEVILEYRVAGKGAKVQI